MQANILEIGNTLQYYENMLSDAYGLHSRLIIDKFEVDLAVENLDIMHLDPQKKYHAIVSVSTVEHVGQHCDPSGVFGEQKQISDREAPLKAIAKVYDLLEVGGRALITVPFGKLIDGGWYIQFSSDYLQLLTTSYRIPQEAISIGLLRRITSEPVWNNPRQIWVEAMPEELAEVRYDDMLSGARAIAVIELTKQNEPYLLDFDVPPTPLSYESSQLSKGLFLTVGTIRKTVSSLVLHR
ncbi:hypothetical protein KSZ_66370 [Dictyobacter formicarum]|uniref:Methyltransferase type 11 domain-containing protein n=2 Tax=Dictyobacter formicarum TaxID=2778368 RepID=A0ABQ3VTJ1_9CHLR|nr:hypothetical protein KSZ_66370 [Dictyobacter formicarum]